MEVRHGAVGGGVPGVASDGRLVVDHHDRHATSPEAPHDAETLVVAADDDGARPVLRQPGPQPFPGRDRGHAALGTGPGREALAPAWGGATARATARPAYQLPDTKRIVGPIAPRSGCADEEQSGDRRLHGAVEHGVAAGPDGRDLQVGVEERVAGDVDAVARAQHHVVDPSELTVVEPHLDPVAPGRDGDDACAGEHGYVDQPRAQPRGTRRPDRPSGHGLGHGPRELPEEIGFGDDAGQAHRADVGGRVHQLRVAAEQPVVATTVQPVDPRRPGDDRHLGRPGLVRERRRLERALASAHDQQRGVAEPREVPVLRRVGAQLGGQVLRHVGPVHEVGDPGSHHDVPGQDLLSVLERDVQARGLASHVRDEPGVRVRGDLGVHPVAVRTELVERHGQGKRGAGAAAVLVERERAVVLADAGRGPVGPQHHAPRHGPPERHRAAEDAGLHACPSQMGHRRETVWSRPDDHAFRLVHRVLSPPLQSVPAPPR